MTKLNKAQQRAVRVDLQAYNLGNIGAAARGLSSLHRSALKRTQKDEILKIALAYPAILHHPDFIICD
jgi:hypothetical protein